MKIEPFRLERYFARHEFSARWLLSSSDCESLSVGELLAMEPGSEDALRNVWLGYTEPTGDPGLRERIAGLYDGREADEVLIHSGAEEAIFNFMNLEIEAGDHLVVHAPCYQSLAEVARSIGAEVSDWAGDPRQGWALDLDDLRSLLRPDTRLVVINVPHNPTGFLPDQVFMQTLAELSEHHGFRIFCDEVYRGLELDPAQRLPAMCDLHPRAVSLGVMSKAFGLAGLRIGWVCSQDQKLLDGLAACKDYTTICSAAPSEFLSELALRQAPRIVDRNLEIIRHNLGLLDAFFARHADRFEWHSPRAGSIAFPSLLSGDAEDFCERLITEADVLLLPGSVYGDYPNSFRVGFGRRNLPEALERLERFVEAC